MQLTVREIIKMIESGELTYDLDTQRNFIYNTQTIPSKNGPITRAGNVIRSILQENIQLPALFFWREANGKYHIHDGKQRTLSCYFFIRQNESETIITNLDDLGDCSWEWLPHELQEKLLNYTFDVVVKEGPQELEETSFYLINTNGVPLTTYEALRGMFHGKFIYEFENYINKKSFQFEQLKRIGRGEQALLFLYNHFDILGEKDADQKIRKHLKTNRNNEFHSDDSEFNKLIEFFSELKHIVNHLKEEVAIAVADYIINKGWNSDKIFDYYREIIKKANDVSRWTLDIHKRAITTLVESNFQTKCDGRRWFSDDDKTQLYARSAKCACPDCTENRYNKLEVDHKIPWSKGGKTILDNAQLLCKHHNSEKGNDEDGFN